MTKQMGTGVIPTWLMVSFSFPFSPSFPPSPPHPQVHALDLAQAKSTHDRTQAMGLGKGL